MPLVDRPARAATRRLCRRPRRGALTVEAALVMPVFVLLLLAIVVGGVGVFHYQQTACLAREAARWASVRGADYRRDTGLPSPTRDDIWNRAVLPLAAGMDISEPALKVEWIDQASHQALDWDAAPKAVRSLTPLGEYVTNSVRVTITYPWTTGLFGSITLSSVCEWPMAF